VTFNSITTLRNVTAGLVLTLSLAACNTIPTSRPEAPKVTLESVKPLKIGLREQQLLFTLKVSNPNSFDLPLQALNFVAALDGTQVATGSSSEAVTLPALGDAILKLTVNSQINKVLSQLMLLISNKTAALDYDVNGTLQLANWPIRIPFAVDGIVDRSMLD